MKISTDRCVACGNCTYVCPMGAIYIDPVIKRATVNLDAGSATVEFDPAQTALPKLIAAIEQLGYQVPAPSK